MNSKKSSQPSGFLLVHKPSGITSFDVIRKLRHILGIKKLGHSGVLDRPASGLLVVGANKATRLFELFGGFEKEYEADIWLGLSTSTDDLTGELLQAGGPGNIGPEEFERALLKYRGTFAQMPPAFSLAKKAGKEMYRYALAGQTVEIDSRDVTVHDSRLLSFEAGIDPTVAIAEEGTGASDGRLAPQADRLPRLTRARIWLKCSGGLYVRSLARDIGSDLKCGGTMGRLLRTRVGPFTLADAHTLEQLEQAEDPASLFQPLSSIADTGSRIHVDATQVDMVSKGQPIRGSIARVPDAQTLFAVGEDEELVCILERGATSPEGFVELKPVKVFL